MATATISFGKVGSGTSSYSQYASTMHLNNSYRCCWSYDMSSIPTNATISSIAITAYRSSNLYSQSQTITFALSSSKAWSYTSLGSTNASVKAGSTFTSDKKCTGSLSTAFGAKMLSQRSGYIHCSSATSITDDIIYSSMSLTVTYTVAATTYNVTYSPGSYASGTTYVVKKTAGIALTLRGSTYTRSGYIQAGWSTSTNGANKTYDLKASYTTDAAITLYPYWELDGYTIQYDPGDYANETTVYNHNVSNSITSVELRGLTYTREGYVQTGWSYSSSGESKDYNLSGTYTDASSVVLYPYWESATITTQMTAKEYFSAGSSGINAYTGYNAYINVGYGHDTGSYKGRLRLNLEGNYSGKNIVSMKLFLAHTSKGGTEFKNSVQGLAIAADNSGAYNASYDATMNEALGYVEGVVSVRHSSSSYWVSWDITALKDIIIANPTCYLKLWDLGTLAGDEHLPCQYCSPTSGSTNYHPYLLITYEEEQSFSVTTDSDYYEAKEGETITITATGSKAMRAISTPNNFPGQTDDIVTDTTNKTMTTTYILNNNPGLYFCSLKYWDADDNESIVNVTINVLPKGTLFYALNGAYREFMTYYLIDGVWHRCYYHYGANNKWIQNK